MSDPLPSYLVESASGVNINLANGEQLIDGMSSWWSVLHGYNHPKINEAIENQLAIQLREKLISLTPKKLEKVFLSDSGSVSVEVAIKMALQYQHATAQRDKKPLTKIKLLTVKNGYHGDTFAAMSVCDPVTGMHQIFDQVLMKHYFAPAPKVKFSVDIRPQISYILRELTDVLSSREPYCYYLDKQL